jgi:hypothetical protein
MDLIKNNISISNLPATALTKITSFETCKCITNDDTIYKND